MKLLLTIFLFFLVTVSPIYSVQAEVNLKLEDVSSIEVSQFSGKSRLFQITDGYEEKIMRKVLNWLNESSLVKSESSVDSPKIPISLTVNMRNGEVIVIQPTYRCILEENQTKICTPVDGEILLYKGEHLKAQLKSQELYDWLMTGWKYEVEGPPKQELLEEVIYTRYLTYLSEKDYSDFFMCPKIDHIERIKGDTRRHIVYASALNYGGHHGGNYDRLKIVLTDTPEDGVQIKQVKKLKNISENESLEQCK
ncbi:hypothetical protein [Bacillus sp. AK128]